MNYNILCGDALDVLKTLPDESVNMCVTSPPYYALRDYGIDGQIGLEESPQAYIDRLVAVFHEVKRVLRDDGTLWVNIGDSYWGSRCRGCDFTEYFSDKKTKQQTSQGTIDLSNLPRLTGNVSGYKNKDLIGIPWMLAFALRADGWYLRQDIIWAKPNPMPESVRDRCTKSHEYLFLLSKSPKYYFDDEAISEPVAASTIARLGQDIEKQQGSSTPSKNNGNMKAVAPRYGGKKYTEQPDKFYRTKSGNAYNYRPRRKKRDVWTVSTRPYKEAHFATFPEKLIEPCILAGTTKSGGVVLDPFSGAGTTGVVCAKNGRAFIGIELNPEYVAMAEKRIAEVKREVDAQNAQITLFDMMEGA